MDAEYEAMSKFVRADRRFRIFLYVVVSLCFLAFIFILYEVHTSNERTQREITSKIDESIKQNRIQNEETRRFDTCLLLVPIEERSVELQRACFEKIDQPGGLESEDFQPTSVDEVSAADQSAFVPSPNFYTSESYANDTAPVENGRRDSSQESNSATTEVADDGATDPQSDISTFLQDVLSPITNQIGGN